MNSQVVLKNFVQSATLIPMAEPKAEQSEKPSKIAFEYVKSNYHRVIWAIGAHGGPTPNGRFINMSLFNERLPIVQREVHSVSPEGALGPLIEKVQRDAIVREVEVTVMLDLDAAAVIAKFLLKSIEKVKELQHDDNDRS